MIDLPSPLTLRRVWEDLYPKDHTSENLARPKHSNAPNRKHTVDGSGTGANVPTFSSTGK